MEKINFPGMKLPFRNTENLGNKGLSYLGYSYNQNKSWGLLVSYSDKKQPILDNDQLNVCFFL